MNAVEKHLNKFKNEVDHHLVETPEIICWRKANAMMEQLNYTKKGGLGEINWANEVQEGWIPYQSFSAHVNKKDKYAMHGFDAGYKMLPDICSLYQYGFGLEGAITMGHCSHTFHINASFKHQCLAQFVPSVGFL